MTSKYNVMWFIYVLPLAPEIWESWYVSDMQRWYSLACKERNSCTTCLVFFGWGMWGVVVVICSDSLAGDAPSWWKPQNLFCSQVFDHIQKVWVLVSGPHCLDNFCRVRVTMVINEGANSSMNRRVFVVGVWSKSLSSKSPSTFILICCSSAASRCRASCDTLGAPGKQIMMMLMLSKLPCRDGQNHHETDPAGR